MEKSTKKTAAPDLAWMENEGELLIAPATKSRSATIELIERIYAMEAAKQAQSGVSHARVILRNRIFASQEPSMSDLEAVKMAAKRITAPEEIPADVLKKFQAGEVLPSAAVPPSFGAALLEMEETLAESDEELELDDIPGLLVKLMRNAHKSEYRYSSDRPISALLLGPENELLAVGWNTSADIRTRHAEWNLCDGVASGAFGEIRDIPAGSTLYVTLKPCRMCAARIWEMCEDPGELEVIYLENDPGPLAQGTMLEPASPARVRHLGMDHELFEHEMQMSWGSQD